ncbi:hypothetical protein AWV79_35545 [Cupriavidus sp. UYMMa02A]|nr:hypothetical protein AWV79_35545 [Cupriavidus sp. UYMMa02A]
MIQHQTGCSRAIAEDAFARTGSFDMGVVWASTTLRQFMTPSLQQLSAYLRAGGLRVRKTSPCEAGADAEIEVTTKVWVQVGASYMQVNRWTDGGQAVQHYMLRPRTMMHMASMLEDVRLAKKDARSRA